MKKSILFAVTSAYLLSFGALAQESVYADSHLPMPFENVFSTAMNDPNVMLYHADQSFRKGNYDEALKWMLKSAEYQHPAAISNTKYMIQNNHGTFENRNAVVDFLKYYAEPRGDQPADMFARIYLADYYRGDKCVWFAPEQKADCTLEVHAPTAGSDLRQSYYYYDGAAEQGDSRSTYTMAMMNLLGLGVPRNVPLALASLKALSDAGSIASSEIVAEVYQQGYWVPQDKKLASQYFMKPLEVGVPNSLLVMASNYESGFAGGEERQRMQLALDTYNRILSSSIATKIHKAEAALRKAILLSTYDALADNNEANNMLDLSVSYGVDIANEFSVKALIMIGDSQEKTSLTNAVSSYIRAISMLENLSLNKRQRHAVVYQKVAYAYASSEGDLDRDERKFSLYMNKHHRLMAKTYVPDVDFTEFSGYSAFSFPG